MTNPIGAGMTTLKPMIRTPTTKYGHGVAGPPQRADHRAVHESARAGQDGSDGDDVVGIGCVTHAQQESETGQREELAHQVRSLDARGSYCNVLQ